MKTTSKINTALKYEDMETYRQETTTHGCCIPEHGRQNQGAGWEF